MELLRSIQSKPNNEAVQEVSSTILNNTILLSSPSSPKLLQEISRHEEDFIAPIHIRQMSAFPATESPSQERYLDSDDDSHSLKCVIDNQNMGLLQLNLEEKSSHFISIKYIQSPNERDCLFQQYTSELPSTYQLYNWNKMFENLKEYKNEAHEQDLYDQLSWTDVYRPRHSLTYIGNYEQVERAKQWFCYWKNTLNKPSSQKQQKKRKRKHQSDDDEDETGSKRRRQANSDDDFIDDSGYYVNYERSNSRETAYPQVLFVQGDHGCGVTSLVNALIEENNFDATEINASQSRVQADLLKQFREVGSHQLTMENITVSVWDAMRLQEERRNEEIKKQSLLSKKKLTKGKQESIDQKKLTVPKKKSSTSGKTQHKTTIKSFFVKKDELQVEEERSTDLNNEQKENDLRRSTRRKKPSERVLPGVSEDEEKIEQDDVDEKIKRPRRKIIRVDDGDTNTKKKFKKIQKKTNGHVNGVTMNTGCISDVISSNGGGLKVKKAALILFDEVYNRLLVTVINQINTCKELACCYIRLVLLCEMIEIPSLNELLLFYISCSCDIRRTISKLQFLIQSSSRSTSSSVRMKYDYLSSEQSSVDGYSNFVEKSRYTNIKSTTNFDDFYQKQLKDINQSNSEMSLNSLLTNHKKNTSRLELDNAFKLFVEDNASGAKDQMRAAQLVKRRQQEHEQIEIKKKKIEEENRMASIDEKFKAHYDAVEQMLKSDTVGLISLDEMKKKQEDIIRAREQQLAREKQAKLNEMLNNSKQGDRKDSLHQRPNKLSFEWLEEEEENNEEVNEIQEKSKSNVENKIDETKLE
ncbi:unnamed protein product, partial [Didymodactylos carnosus]